MRKLHPVYWIVPALAFGGGLWLAFDLTHPGSDLTPCLVKNIAGVPCPACGSSRAAALLLRGHPIDALWMNPLGVISVLTGTIALIWIMTDLIRTRRTFLVTYLAIEQVLVKKVVLIPAVILLALNWIWNFEKGL